MADLAITAGQTERFTATFTNADGTPINLSGVAVTLENEGTSLGAEVMVTNAATGAVAVAIPATSTGQITRRRRVRFKRHIAGGDTYLDEWFWLVPR